jgi:hypothetical protein
MPQFGGPPKRGPNPFVIGCLGCGGLLVVLIVIGGIIAAMTGGKSHGGDAFKTKATLNERVASERAGGFSDDDKRLYHQGLQHLINAHKSVGSYTIGQVIDQEKSRDEQRKNAADAAKYAAEHHDYCNDAVKQEKIAAAKSSTSPRAAYNAAVAGLAANEKCDNENANLINKGYLLSMKAYAEHGLGNNEWHTDFNQANALLVQCQTTPGLYGTRTGAECETQEKNNISAETNWDIHG